MKTFEEITAKFERLLMEGREILTKCGWDSTGFQGAFPDTGDYIRFRTEAENLTRRVCGETSDHYLELRRIADHERLSHNSYYFNMVYGALEAASKDFSEGFLSDLRSLVAAELFGGFLEQAEHLFSGGFYMPAASLAGAVLEDSLRRLCERHSITVPEKSKIDSLNVALARASVYDKLVQKQITAHADIRNSADHGQFAKVRENDVGDMIRWVRRFDGDYLH